MSQMDPVPHLQIVLVNAAGDTIAKAHVPDDPAQQQVCYFSDYILTRLLSG